MLTLWRFMTVLSAMAWLYICKDDFSNVPKVSWKNSSSSSLLFRPQNFRRFCITDYRDEGCSLGVTSSFIIISDVRDKKMVWFKPHKARKKARLTGFLFYSILRLVKLNFFRVLLGVVNFANSFSYYGRSIAKVLFNYVSHAKVLFY